MNISYVVTEEQQFVDVCFTFSRHTWFTVDVVTSDNTAVGMFVILFFLKQRYSSV